jgi:hypothetical protein
VLACCWLLGLRTCGRRGLGAQPQGGVDSGLAGAVCFLGQMGGWASKPKM